MEEEGAMRQAQAAAAEAERLQREAKEKAELLEKEAKINEKEKGKEDDGAEGGKEDEKLPGEKVGAETARQYNFAQRKNDYCGYRQGWDHRHAVNINQTGMLFSFIFVQKSNKCKGPARSETILCMPPSAFRMKSPPLSRTHDPVAFAFRLDLQEFGRCSPRGDITFTEGVLDVRSRDIKRVSRVFHRFHFRRNHCHAVPFIFPTRLQHRANV